MRPSACHSLGCTSIRPWIAEKYRCIRHPRTGHPIGTGFFVGDGGYSVSQDGRLRALGVEEALLVKVLLFFLDLEEGEGEEFSTYGIGASQGDS